MPLDSIAVFSVLDRVTNSDGTPVSEGTVEFYLAGTSTPLTVYSDYGLTSSLGTTVSLNSAGYPVSGGGSVVSVYTGTSAYKIIVKDADGVTISDLSRDNIKGAPEIPATNETALPEVPVVVKTAAYTVVDADQGKLIVLNCTGGSFLATLPSAVTVGDGWSVGFLMGGTANTTGFKTTAGETITIRGKDLTSVPMATKGDVIWVTSDGANWRAQSVSSGAVAGLNTIIVTDRLTAPPTSPSGGAVYLINGTPTGAWATLALAEDQIAIADGNGSWTAYTPSAGWRAWIVDEALETIFDGTEWVDQTNTTAPTESALKIALYTYTVSQNTSGGSATNSSWTTYPLNTEDHDTIGASINSGTGIITLPTGTYIARMSATFYASQTARFRVSNQTTSAKIYGILSYSPSFGTTPPVATASTTVMTAPFSVSAATEEIKIEYYQVGASATLGVAQNVSGLSEKYGSLEIIKLDAIQGPQGDQGTQGVDGLDAAYPYQWSTSTSGDPGSGKIRGNNATITSITEIAVSETDSAGGAMGGVIDTWDSGTSSVKARIKISKEGATQNFHYFYITGAGTDQGSYWTFPVSYTSTSGTISNGDNCAVLVIEKGDKGDTGANGVTGSTSYTFSTTTTDSDPGSGIIRLNHATPASATAAYIDNNNKGGSDVSAWLDTFDDTGDSTFRGHLYICDSAAPTTVFRIYKTTGSVTDGTGYRKVSLTHIAGAGSYTNGNEVLVSWLPRGATGVGDVTGAASSTDNAIVRFDGTGGKTIQDSLASVDDSGNLSAVGATLTQSLTLPGSGSSYGINYNGQVITRNSGESIVQHLGQVNGQSVSLHMTPPASPSTEAITEFVLHRTATQAANTAYGRYSLTALGSNHANINGMFFEYNGAATIPVFACTIGINAISGDGASGGYPAYPGVSRTYYQLLVGDDLGNVAFGVGDATARDAVQMMVGDIGSAGTRDSHSILWKGKSNDGTEHAVDWRAYTKPTSNSGASRFVLENRLDAAGWAEHLSISNQSVMALGVSGSTTASIRLYGGTSGSALITAQAVAGSPTLTLPNTSGTLVSTASSPLSINSTTGALSLGTVPVANGGTGVTSSTGSGSVVLSASPTLTGTVNGDAATWTGAETAARFIPTGSTIPTNGMYLSASNEVAFSTNGTRRFRIDSSGQSIVSGTFIITDGTSFGGNFSLGNNAAAVLAGASDGSALTFNTAGYGTLVFNGTTVTIPGIPTALSATAIPAGGTTGSGYKFSSTANFGIFFGSDAPTLSAAKGSLYLRSDGSSTSNRMYVNTDGSTAWTAVTTAT